MRSSRSPHSAARRSSDSARCEPRLFGARAWISSTITVRVVFSIARPGLRAQQDVERLRRRHHDMRRALARMRSRSPCGVSPGAHPGADVDVGQPLRAQRRADAGQRRLQVALDVVGERLERGDVDDLGLVLERPLQPLPHQRIDGRQEGRQRLAGAGRRRDQHVSARLDRRPRFGLRRRGRGEVAAKPRGDRGMEQVGRAHGTVVRTWGHAGAWRQR